MHRIRMMTLPLLLLAGCGSSPDGAQEGAVTEAEAEALDRAAEQLDKQGAAVNLSAPDAAN